MPGSAHDFTKSCIIEVDKAWLGSCFYMYHRVWQIPDTGHVFSRVPMSMEVLDPRSCFIHEAQGWTKSCSQGMFLHVP